MGSSATAGICKKKKPFESEPAQKVSEGYLCIEGFSGPGGMTLGLKRAGFSLGVAFDFNEKAVETHCRNLDDRCVQADARDITGRKLLRACPITL
jgi:DNA (cytosine-5)-methyltransferase 1